MEREGWCLCFLIRYARLAKFCSPDGAQRNPGRPFRCSIAPGLRFAPSGLRNKLKEAERRQTQGHNRRILRCGARPFGARTLDGVPPRLSSRGVSHPQGQLQARLPGTRSERALPAFACPSPGKHLPSRSSCRETDTQAAREQHAKPPAGTAPAPPFGLPPEGVLRESGINSYVIKVVTNVNRKGTSSEASPARGGL